MQSTITCSACGHAYALDVPDGTSEQAFFESNVFKCTECGARTSYGKLMPRIVIEPFYDDRGVGWLRRKYLDAKTNELLFQIDLDPQYAAMQAKNELSLVIP